MEIANMMLKLPPSTIVFRKVVASRIRIRRKWKIATKRYPWHILKKRGLNGFSKKTHPDEPTWWQSKTSISMFDVMQDERDERTKLEFSTVGKIRKVCPSCWQFHKIIPSRISKRGMEII